jgi:phosphoglycerate dehydrogenase-like enzyme
VKKIISTYGPESDLYRRLTDDMVQYAKDRGFAYEWEALSNFDPKIIARALKRADAVLIDTFPIGEEAFSSVRGQGKLLVTLSAGYDHIDIASASDCRVSVAHTPGANALGVAEMALALILGTRRLFPQNEYIVRNNGNWFAQEIASETVASGTVGLVGFGAVGKALARILVGLGCRVLVYARRPDAVLAREIGVEFVSIDAIFTESDAISIHLAYNEQTHHFVNERLLHSMKPDAVLVNTARGRVVDEEALCKLLHEKRIRGAGLDVFGEEPLPQGSPFLALSNVILAPHAGTNTKEAIWRVHRMGIDVTADFYGGRPSNLLNASFAQ